MITRQAVQVPNDELTDKFTIISSPTPMTRMNLPEFEVYGMRGRMLDQLNEELVGQIARALAGMLGEGTLGLVRKSTRPICDDLGLFAIGGTVAADCFPSPSRLRANQSELFDKWAYITNLISYVGREPALCKIGRPYFQGTDAWRRCDIWK